MQKVEYTNKPLPKPTLNMCEHKWVYQMSDYICEKVGYYKNEYSRIDTYYCEKCCEVKKKINEMELRCIDNGKPTWWR